VIWNLWEDDQGESIKKTTFEPKLQTNDVRSFFRAEETDPGSIGISNQNHVVIC
ncbi:unnamed protein product, partial [Brassica oleracea var. botrytis]